VIQVVVFSVVTPCSVAVGHQRFGGSSCLHLQGEDGGTLHDVTTNKTTSWIYRHENFESLSKCDSGLSLWLSVFHCHNFI